MRGVLLIALLAGCNQILGVTSITLGDGGAAHGSDAFIPANACIPGTLIKPCFVTLPSDPITITANTLDTDNDPRCIGQRQTSGPDVCLIGGSTLTVMEGTIRPSGSRPLVLVAVTDLDVQGTIDVRGGEADVAAGANTSLCVGTGAGGSGSSAGGGGGGAFGTSSAAGGAGSAVAGGLAGGTPALVFVRGGCNGGAGGMAATPGGLGGTAGGAVYLVAGNSVTIETSGVLLASGGGGGAGGGGANPSGGGGGASGGLIGLDAPNVEVDGTIIASGGGGGGAGGTGGQTGTDTTATGGTAPSGDGAGGNGGVGATAPTKGATATDCGGGGGGSVGVVWMNYTTSTETGEITPAETDAM